MKVLNCCRREPRCIAQLCAIPAVACAALLEIAYITLKLIARIFVQDSDVHCGLRCSCCLQVNDYGVVYAVIALLHKVHSLTPHCTFLKTIQANFCWRIEQLSKLSKFMAFA